MNFTIENDLLNYAKTKLECASNTMMKIKALSNSLKKYPPEYEFIGNVESLLSELPNIFNAINNIVVKLGGFKVDFGNSFKLLKFNMVNENNNNVTDTITNYFYDLHSKKNNLTVEEQKMYLTIKEALKINLINNVNVNYNYKKYDLTEDEIKQIASLCMQEQGSVEGAKAEASLMANLFEQRKKEGKATNIYDYVRNSGWFANSKKFMDKRNATGDINEAVKSVLVDGNRTLPLFINEHDCLSDIDKISNNQVVVDKNNKDSYIKNVTKVQQSTNSFGVNAGTWIYYTYPGINSDPFGYTNKSLEQTLDELIDNHDIRL